MSTFGRHEVFQIAGQEAVAAADLAAERVRLARILAAVETGQLASEPVALTAYGPITPWIAQQLGVVAEHAAVEGDESSLELARVAVHAAVVCQDTARQYANLLTLAGVHLRRGHLADADRVIDQLFALPVSGHHPERGSAHLFRAQLLARQRRPEARRHYELAVCLLGRDLPERANRTVLATVLPVYVEQNDLVGGLIASQYDAQGRRAALAHRVRSLSLDEAISVASRLSLVGASDLVAFVEQEWSRRHAG